MAKYSTSPKGKEKTELRLRPTDEYPDSGSGELRGDSLARFHGLVLPRSRGFGDEQPSERSWEPNSVIVLGRLGQARIPTHFKAQDDAIGFRRSLRPEMDWGNVTAEDLIEALREVDWSSPPRPLSEFFSSYRTNYFIMVVFILGLSFLRRPLTIVAAALTALSIAFLNDRHLLVSTVICSLMLAPLKFQHLVKYNTLEIGAVFTERNLHLKLEIPATKGYLRDSLLFYQYSWSTMLHFLIDKIHYVSPAFFLIIGAAALQETLLVHEDLSSNGELQKLVDELQLEGVTLFGGPRVSCFLNIPEAQSFHHEYSSRACTIEIVSDVHDAIDHIHKYGRHVGIFSAHTDCIVAEDHEVAELFLTQADSAAVFHNASTRFCDGARFGLGAEVGISTSRIHARGPVGVEGLLTTRWILRGNGQVVDGDKGVNYTHKKPRPRVTLPNQEIPLKFGVTPHFLIGVSPIFQTLGFLAVYI
ncbi:delta 1-pyrroline-5-carboxylate synthase 2 [Actinidia rufa]|uniref:Delta 1-pyrroline-5-carboxylate synthase 2 n=1 Tax=Actinidia rufa TaxID=165716 RepID=A0A7J0FUY2_9ERIC|nr:delta 1-pyrroline-5-carboxylate synthase 2 [Actinidia rufa]